MDDFKLLEELLALDDQITDFDQEDLDGIEELQEQKNAIFASLAELSGPEPEEPEDPDVPKRELKVECVENQVFFSSNIDTVVALDGDVRKHNVRLIADRQKSRKLINNGKGFVSFDGEEYEHDWFKPVVVVEPPQAGIRRRR